nr:uncharacterized protein LOC118877196 [Drosophila suzukii]
MMETRKFMEEWPKYRDSRATELQLTLEFSLLYPSREALMPGKWDDFRTRILDYYRDNINPIFKELYKKLPAAQNMDSTDYMITTLLPAVLAPTTWYKDARGQRKKFSMMDSKESLVLRLPEGTEVSQIDLQIRDIMFNNYGYNYPIQPLLIVEGSDSIDKERINYANRHTLANTREGRLHAQELRQKQMMDAEELLYGPGIAE